MEDPPGADDAFRLGSRRHGHGSQRTKSGSSLRSGRHRGQRRRRSSAARAPHDDVERVPFSLRRASERIRSSAVRIVCVLAILLGAGLFAGWDEAGSGVAVVLDVLWLAIFAFALGWLWRHRGRLRQAVGAYPLVLLSIVLLGIVVSPAWSFDPVASVRDAGSIVLTTAVGLMLGLASRSSEIVDVLVTACAVWLVTALIATLAFPDLAFQPYPIYPEGSAQGWAGLQGNKNLTGSTAAIACLVFAVALLRGRLNPRFAAALLVGALGALIGAYSVTALISGGIGLAILVTFVLAHRARLPSVVVFVLGLISLGVAAYLGVLFAEQVTATFGKAPSLTGRTEVWSEAVDMTAQAPWTGYGAGVVWGLGEQSWLQEYGTTLEVDHAHNGLLHLATQFGWPLALVAAVQIAVTAWLAVLVLARQKTSFAYFALAYVFLFVGHNIAESGLFRANYDEWIIYVAIVARLSLLGARPADRGVATGSSGRLRRSRSRRRTSGSGAPEQLPVPDDRAGRFVPDPHKVRMPLVEQDVALEPHGGQRRDDQDG